VTVARYRTPAGADIDLRGILPDMTCTPPIIGAARGGRGAGAAVPAPAAAAPGAGADASAMEVDSCLLTAMNVLADRSALIEATAGGVAVAPEP